ncbi:MAG: hypothetical protein HS115_19105 [Spirochaetales bacterium]|nr:hypothetical protein [Spirochaetales bacterium]
MSKLEESLSQYKADNLTVKLCSTIFQVVPGGPEFVFYDNLEAGVKRHNPSAGADVVERARTLGASDDAAKAIWVADALDTADAGLGIYTGVKNLFSLFGKSAGPAKRTFEADPQQAADAALKGVGLAYMIHKLFPGSIAEKVNAFKSLKAGQEIATYYAVAEVALPFADNLVEGGGNLVEKLMNSNTGAIKDKFAGFAGAEAFSQATGVLSQLTAPLEGYISAAKGHTDAVMERIKGYLPGAMNVADSVSGAAATGVDLMPVWRFLGARLVVEACAYRAERA